MNDQKTNAKVRGSAMFHFVSGPLSCRSFPAHMENGQVCFAIPPEAGIRPIAYDDPQKKELEQLALHHLDLIMAGVSISHIVEIGFAPETWALRDSLWYAAVTRFIKCFQKGESRSPLIAERVFAGNSSRLRLYKFFKSLRNKHLVHDENSFDQSHLVIFATEDGSLSSPASVSLFTQRLNTSEFYYVRRLQILITRTHSWVVSRALELGNEVSERASKVSPSDIKSKPTVQLQFPHFDDVSKAR